MKVHLRRWPLVLWLVAMGLCPIENVAAQAPVAGAQCVDGVAIHRSVALAARYLNSRQSPDGAWKSDTYATFREGDCLTALVLCALSRSTDRAGLQESHRRGVDYINRLSKRLLAAGDAEEQPLNYPIYTAANAILALESLDDTSSAQPWRAYLQARQLTEELGWTPEDPEYGGWGYAGQPSRKPALGQPLPPLSQPNISATCWALRALNAQGTVSDIGFRKAAKFVERCQNVTDDLDRRQATFDDGGFGFMLADPVRNKAGMAGRDRNGRPRFRSYTSPTADGLSALILSAHDRNGSRCQAARHWLQLHFSADEVAGDFPPDRQAQRRSAYYYACRSVSQLLVDEEPGDRRLHAAALARELIHRQLSDGSWRNDAVELREDDPLVATSFAYEALVACQSALTACDRTPANRGSE